MCSKLTTLIEMSVTRHMPTLQTRIQCQIDYWATLNSKQDLSAPSIPLRVRLVGANNHEGSDCNIYKERLANRLPFNCSCFYTK